MLIHLVNVILYVLTINIPLNPNLTSECLVTLHVRIWAKATLLCMVLITLAAVAREKCGCLGCKILPNIKAKSTVFRQ